VSARNGTAGLFSIGHSNVPLEKFLGLLEGWRIHVVADVRTSPRSRYVPHFDAEPLRLALHNQGIRYVFMGDQLGGRPDGDEYYDRHDHVLYGRLAQSQPFLDGLDRVVTGSTQYRVALLCSEEDPTQCHRYLLISRVLGDRGIPVHHIRGDGTAQRDADLHKTESQAALFSAGNGEEPWRSIRSVSRRSQQPSSSAH
jgi:uncharacterized protein (DUF488 family)